MKHYLHQKIGKWIVEFDDTTKQFYLYYLAEPYEEFDTESIEVAAGEEVHKNNDGSLIKCGNCKTFNTKK